MVVWAGADGATARRLGMKVTKKTFRLATERNRAKRLLRESFRLLRPTLAATPWDLVVIARRKILDAKEPEVRKEMAWACRKLGLARHAADTKSGKTSRETDLHIIDSGV